MSSKEGRLLPAIRAGIFKGFQEGQSDIANTLSLKRSASKITFLTEGVMCLSWVSSLKCFVPYGRLKEKERDTHASEKLILDTTSTEKPETETGCWERSVKGLNYME